MNPTTSNGEEPIAGLRRHLPRPVRRALMIAAVLAGLHLAVASPHFIVRLVRGSPTDTFVGVDNFAQVDETLWRGGAPTTEGYAALAAAGVETIIDLRAESDRAAVQEVATAVGISVLPVPIRDGQVPTRDQIALIADTIIAADGPVFVHCQAGVGRTGSVVASLRVADGSSSGAAVIEALRFGPISLEQQLYILRPSPDPTIEALIPVVASRIIDSPRRLWSRISG